MGKRNLIFLLVAALVAALGAWLVTDNYREKVRRVAEIHTLVPELSGQIAKVTTIRFTEAGKSFQLKKDPEQGWVIVEKHNYPADEKKITALFSGMISVKVLEPRTDDPNKHAKLHLEPPENGDAKSFGVQLIDADNKVIVDLVLGKKRQSAGGSMQQFYVRKADENKTWLAIGELDPEHTPRDWVDRQLIDISNKRISQISIIRPGGSTSTFSRPDPEAEFKLEDLPKGRKASQQKMISASYGMQNLPINDVYQKQEQPNLPWNAATRVLFETFDGLRINTLVLPAGDHFYQQLEVSYDKEVGLAYLEKQPKTDESNKGDSPQEPPSPDKIAADIDEINKGLQPWVFLVPGHTVDTFTPALDILAPAE